MLPRVMTATHRAGGLASDDMAGGREGAERLPRPAQGRKPSFTVTLGTTHTSRGPPSPAPSVPPCLHPCPWPSPGQAVCAAAGGVQPHRKARPVRVRTEKGPACRDAGGLGRSPTGPGRCRRPRGCSQAGRGSGPCEQAHEGCSTGPGLTAGAALTPCGDRGHPPPLTCFPTPPPPVSWGRVHLARVTWPCCSQTLLPAPAPPVSALSLGLSALHLSASPGLPLPFPTAALCSFCPGGSACR